jgi:hypothetical protein
MTAEQAITQAAALAKVASRNGDEAGEAYWTARAVILSDQREAMRRRADFNELKGHPDHSSVSHA